MSLQVTLGDLLVAGSVVIAVVAAYYAVKGQLASFKLVLEGFSGRLDAHATRLRQHSADIRYTGRRVAALEGRVFNRRVDDRTPGEISQPGDDTEED